MKHEFQDAVTIGTPDNPSEAFTYCVNDGVEKTDENVDEECPRGDGVEGKDMAQHWKFKHDYCGDCWRCRQANAPKSSVVVAKDEPDMWMITDAEGRWIVLSTEDLQRINFIVGLTAAAPTQSDVTEA